MIIQEQIIPGCLEGNMVSLEFITSHHHHQRFKAIITRQNLGMDYKYLNDEFMLISDWIIEN